MKKIFFAFALAVVAIVSCSEDGTSPSRVDRSPYSGTYSVLYTVIETDCASTTPLAGNTTISIADTEITWDNMKGRWDEDTKRVTGKSVSPTCVPINYSTGCYGCFEMPFDITFASVDSFYGLADLVNSYSPSCGVDTCHVLYSVTGTR